MNISHEFFRVFLYVMIILAIIVFVALYFVKVGYGMMLNKSWGKTISNRWAWMFMEAPVFLSMCFFFICSPRKTQLVPIIFFLLFQMHYFQRAFIFPWLIKGRGQMPLSIMSMGIVFNLINSFMQGEWIFYLSPEDMYTVHWLASAPFVAGTLIFLAGFVINLYADYIIRHLRQDGETRHYLPQKGLFKYVTSANYFGEIIEWMGFAVLTWSLSGFVFFLWTCANLVPRANAIYHKYLEEFPEEMLSLNPKRVLPFIY